MFRKKKTTRKQQLVEAIKNLTVTSKERNEIVKDYYQEKLNILKEAYNLRRKSGDFIATNWCKI